ncbi:Alpha/Beta hydrolase protein [Annulohypoxylon maeteangense]|uniref:Alpha/Beta hydrolase protein n=1 Tax=Annulohypoxylon maeteangense TaxID=1927788 RepID=UPI002008045E|nr:Alpha/Beta hydrolase protein [Annulohypoxylon maeteangense]KAI0882391.1 Alpha/Beta hydrolase protein [Annulohypoxylon maeteangense]
MLPRPSLSFTLPSLHDNTKLDCRIYHPACLNGPLGPSDTLWHQHAAVVAHPYAPLGGSYDDPVVHLVANTLLNLGFVVATFNFRGASSSYGRTSWTSKPERADYKSVAGFLVYYVHYLSPPQHNPNPTLLLAGYSYGAMVTIQLPPLDSFLSDFASPAAHTAFADIRLRAQHLAEQQIIISTTPSSPRKSLGLRVGGDEDTTLSKTRENPRSRSPNQEERIRKGVKEILSRHRLIHRKHNHSSVDRSEGVGRDETFLESVDNLIRFRCSFLLISPPLGIITNLATMSFSNPLASRSKRKRGVSPSSTSNHGGKADREEVEAEMKLIRNPTLVVFGNQDGFLAINKMRDWVLQLGKPEGSHFHHVEVSGAGHFWVEEGVGHKLRSSVSSFATRLIESP